LTTQQQHLNSLIGVEWATINGTIPHMFSLTSVRLWCYAAFAAGIGFSIWAIGSEIFFSNLRRHSAVTTGTITSVDVDPGDENLYCPHFRFEAADKHTYTGTCHIWEKGTSPSFSEGDVVSIRYRPSDPSYSWLETQVHDYPRDAASWGACCLGLGFALLLYARIRGISLKFFN
jgi:hypothetical protein